MGLPVVVCPGSAMHSWFSHSDSPQTKSSAVRASASGALTGTSAGTGTRTVVRTAAAVVVARMSTSTGTHRCYLCTTAKKRRDRAWNCSSCLSRRYVLPVAMDHACTTALYLLHLHAAGLHTVSCGTLAHLVRYCCCAVPVPVLVLLIAARFHPR